MEAAAHGGRAASHARVEVANHSLAVAAAAALDLVAVDLLQIVAIRLHVGESMLPAVVRASDCRLGAEH